MSALALCLVDIDMQIHHKSWIDSPAFRQKASEGFRLASGSAARSVYPFVARWGLSTISNKGSNNYADYAGNNVDPIFSDYKTLFLYFPALPSPYPVAQAIDLWRTIDLPQNDLSKLTSILSNCSWRWPVICPHLYEL